MSSRISRSAAIAVLVLASGAAYAQPEEGQSPPIITDVEWRIFRNNSATPVLVSPVPFALLPPFDPVTDTARELDVLVARANVCDADFAGDEAGDQVFSLQQTRWVPVPGYPSPQPPPIPQGGGIFLPAEGDGLRPPAGQTCLDLFFQFSIPDYLGRNQARLRGDINYDVAWTFVIAVSNEQAPEGCQFAGEDRFLISCPATVPVDIHFEMIFAVENPFLRAPNPPAFADAGADMVVAAGSTVQLDGSRTFDGFNIGFNPLDPNVFEKDEIEYTWEWIGGPERVEPIIRDPLNAPAIGEVTLNTVGNYVYRLFVDDGANPLPTSDSVLIEVVSTIPDNRKPRAVITRPTPVIVVGSIITLDGTQSSDPDGDPLSFRWRQTDELGGTLSAADLRDVFQPLGGIETPLSRWQAIKPGTYYFRLLVSDGDMEDSARIDIRIVEAGTLGIAIQRPDVVLPGGSGQPAPVPASQTADSPAPAATPNQVVPLCGGGLLSLAAVPLVLGLLRWRRW